MAHTTERATYLLCSCPKLVTTVEKTIADVEENDKNTQSLKRARDLLDRFPAGVQNLAVKLQLEGSERALTTLSGTTKYLKRDLAASKEDEKALTRDLAASKEDIAALNLDLAASNLDVAALTRDLAASKDEVAALTCGAAALASDNAALSEKIESLNAVESFNALLAGGANGEEPAARTAGAKEAKPARRVSLSAAKKEGESGEGGEEKRRGQRARK